MKTLVEEIAERLTESNIDFQIDQNEITIIQRDENGFQILIQFDDRENTLYFDTWHIHFENDEAGINELLEYLWIGLTKFGRLKTFYRNGKEYKWSFESFNPEDAKWYPMGITAKLNFKFWQKREIKFFQNEMIPVS